MLTQVMESDLPQACLGKRGFESAAHRVPIERPTLFIVEDQLIPRIRSSLNGRQEFRVSGLKQDLSQLARQINAPSFVAFRACQPSGLEVALHQNKPILVHVTLPKLEISPFQSE